MWHADRIARASLVCLWLACGAAAGQTSTVGSPAVSPASKVPTQLPERDCSALTQNYYRQVNDLLSRMMGTTGTIQALNFQIQALRDQLAALNAERAALTAGGTTKGEQIRASEITQQMESLTARIESLQDQISSFVRQQRAIQEEIERVNAEYAARRKALRCA